jgi:cell division protein FtsZ
MMGTGEADGPNRALEAAERAISNPLLDGVSMQGAKGVIISIIGGEDMKLREVDEAANHIRDLVDPNANIIWGSAFNPDLQGKIRVSVVATGIEQTDQQVQEISRGGFGMGGARGIARPGTARGGEPESAAPVAAPIHQPELTPAPQPAAVPEPAPGFAPPPEAVIPSAPASFAPEPVEPEPLELQLDALAEPEPPMAAEPASEPEPTAPIQGGPDGDELLLDDGNLADEPPASPLAARRRPLVSEPEERTPRLSGGGSTLFERMANLSRGGGRKAEEDGGDDGDGPAISIPRFLGRQNNQ